ncbi:MAG: ribonuclease III [bacterium]
MSEIEKKIGYKFRDPGLLKLSLTHASSLKEKKTPGMDNQRLEFLGDAVLQLGVSHLLMDKYPEADEGELSFLRIGLVRKETLAQVAVGLDIDKHVLVDSNLASMNSTGISSVAADAFEAVLGAVYLDGGWYEALTVIERVLGELPVPAGDLRGSKSALQELIQKKYQGEIPKYSVTTNPNATEEERFVSKVYHRGEFLGEGMGRSKKRAQEDAAQKALEAMGGNE